MIFQAGFKKPLLFSFLGHLAVFGIFCFSFGPRIPDQNFSGVSFLGAVLRHTNTAAPALADRALKYKYDASTDARIISPETNYAFLAPPPCLKPQAKLDFSEEKIAFRERAEKPAILNRKADSSVTFHPYLPYHFLLYFKDRQMAHMEIMFKIDSEDGAGLVSLKRKISSGNLEADLLSMRYLSHYLFIQQNRFPLDAWQSVKIELTAKEK